MAQPITPVKGFEGSITINGATAKLTGWEMTIENATIPYMTTGQSADANSQYWENNTPGRCKASGTIRGYWDQNATAAARWPGATYGLLPGVYMSGTLVLTIKSGSSMSMTALVSNTRSTKDAEGDKPDAFEASFVVDGAVAWTLS